MIRVSRNGNAVVVPGVVCLAEYLAGYLSEYLAEYLAEYRALDR